MKERPILFSAPMVRAILSGDKTQTRRIAKDVRHPDLGNVYTPGALVLEREPQHVIERACPYGRPGDRLWVRETWGVVSHTWDDDGAMIDWTPDRPATKIHELPFGRGYYSGHVIYAADGSHEWAGDDDGGGEPRSLWHPSIHMPRAASRILLEITGVRVERLQDISDFDAEDEGTRVWAAEVQKNGNKFSSIRSAWQAMWESINGPDSWQANPWVWVVEFRRIA
ncbi:hypothetical protein [Herbaspirillum sp. CAH-3]|uniref:hypothetical protein n=1 Tax=Herbaspirillum sp. CAH-3 TaxID=2605746 RepID=UPI00351B5A97